MTFNIFTYGNGDVMYQIFTGIALLMGAGYESLVRVGLGLLAIGLIGMFLIQRRMLGSVLIGVLLILGTALAIRVSVIIQDLVNPFIPDRVIGNVPLAVAFPAYVQSEVGYRLMVLAQTALSIPGEYQMTSATFARPFYDLQKLLAMSLPDGDLAKNVMGYMKDCVFLEIGMDQLLLEDIMKSGDALTAIATDNFSLTTWQIQNGNPTTQLACPDMYNTVIVPGLAYGNADYEQAMTDLRRALGVEDVANQEETPIGQDLTAVLGSGQTARQAINTLLVRQGWLSAEQQVNVDKNDAAAAVSNMQTQIQNTLKTQAYAQSYVASKFIPMLRTIAEAGTYTLTPFIIAAAFVPGMFRVLGLGVKTYLWLLLWAPIYVVINFVVYTYGSSLLNALGTVSMDSFPRLDDTLLTLNSFASQVVWAVPIIAAAVAWGTGSLANAFMSGAVGAQLVAGREAEAYAHGQGTVLREGRQYETQSVPVFDADGHSVQYASVPYGAGGVVIDHQSGMREVLHSDGGRTALSPNGVETYSGPSGHYSRKGDYYYSGVWRQEDYDQKSGQIVNMQTQVMGSGLRSDFLYSGADGNQRAVEQYYNQDSKQVQSRHERFVMDGMVDSRDIGPDGQETFTRSGNRTIQTELGGATLPLAGYWTFTGRRDPGAKEDTITQAMLQSTVEGKTQTLRGTLSGTGEDMVFHVAQGSEISGVSTEQGNQSRWRDSVKVGDLELTGEFSAPGRRYDPGVPVYFSGAAKGKDGVMRSGDAVLLGDSILWANTKKDIHGQPENYTMWIGGVGYNGKVTPLGDPTSGNTGWSFSGVVYDPATRPYSTTALLTKRRNQNGMDDWRVVYDEMKAGHHSVVQDFEEEVKGSQKELKNIDHEFGASEIVDRVQKKTMPVLVDSYYGVNEKGSRSLVAGMIRNTENAEVATMMVNDKGEQVWGILRASSGAGDVDHGASAGTFSNVTHTDVDDHNRWKREVLSPATDDEGRRISLYSNVLKAQDERVVSQREFESSGFYRKDTLSPDGRVLDTYRSKGEQTTVNDSYVINDEKRANTTWGSNLVGIGGFDHENPTAIDKKTLEWLRQVEISADALNNASQVLRNLTIPFKGRKRSNPRPAVPDVTPPSGPAEPPLSRQELRDVPAGP